MDPFGFFLGAATFSMAVKFQKPLRKAAVAATSQILSVMQGLKSTAYGLREEIEDIVAEAQYENMKNNLPKDVVDRNEPNVTENANNMH